MSRIEGGGQDTVAWVSWSWPPPLFYRSQLHFHCMSGIEGGGQDTVAWVSWPPLQTFNCFWNYKNIQLCVQEMLWYFRIKLFPNITTLFYRSQLHVPLYVRNTGWGSRYRGLGILTPTPDFCFWNYKKFSYVCKKCSDIFESNCFLTRLLFFINHSYMFHCISGIEGGGQETVAWVSWPPLQTFNCFWNYKNFSYVSKKCSDIFKSNCFLT